MFFNLFSYQKFSEFINGKDNFYKIFFGLIIFLSLLKLPPVFSSDIQPWDEGMYATRVLSIEKFGDILDQSAHSVGKYYSSSHPPLLIWIGYAASKLTGLNAVTLKLVTYFFAILCLFYLMKIGTLLWSQEAGFLSAVIFSSNIIFNIFSKRFQFDIPYTFFVILSCYFFIKYIIEGSRKYILLCGAAAGLCLLSKLLVGLIIPIILFCSLFVIKKNTRFTVKDFFIITGIALCISLPWYLYLLFNNSGEALNYILNFHLYQRATVGVEQNAKGTGIFYFANYFLSIVPFGFLLFYSLFDNLRKFRSIDWKIKFACIWFIAGFVIVTIFKTKLESYSFLFLPAACLLIGDLVTRLNSLGKKEKVIILILSIFNLAWYFTESHRNNLKEFLSENLLHKVEIVIAVAIVSVILFVIIKAYTSKIQFNSFFVSFILLTFVFSNFYYFINVPFWEDGYKINDIKKIIDKDKSKQILYVATNYKHNPQLTFYFSGADLDWGEKISGYKFSMIDTKVGLDSIRKSLNKLERDYFIIVEKDNINRAEYPKSDLFIPSDFTLLNKTMGYELYKNF